MNGRQAPVRTLRVAALVTGLIISLASSSPALAQTCPLCYNAAAVSKAGAVHALRSGVLVLLIPPLVMFAGIFVLAFHRNRRDQAALDNWPQADNQAA